MEFNPRGFFGDSNAENLDLISMEQTHSNTVCLIDRDSQGQICVINHDLPAIYQHKAFIKNDLELTHENASPFRKLNSSFVVNSDAMITCRSDVILSVRTADCLPILIKAPPYIAVIHAGRQGTLDEISYRVAQCLDYLGASAANIWFGPHACVCCYEIHSETATHFDMLTENRYQLANGLGKISSDLTSKLCTFCDHPSYYSYRKGDQLKRNVFYLMKK
ncbi:MAG: polyphenol oxidase family protein [Candidatus Margulisiibacteriota bacterium]